MIITYKELSEAFGIDIVNVRFIYVGQVEHLELLTKPTKPTQNGTNKVISITCKHCGHQWEEPTVHDHLNCPSCTMDQ